LRHRGERESGLCASFDYNEGQIGMSNQQPGEVVEVIVNGEARTIAAGSSIVALLETMGLPPERVAVELNRQIVRRADWAAVALPEGAQLEIVQFVGGG
jgi:thiamine biosynthesis protein ThiS